MVDGATKAKELTSVWDILYDVISTNITDPAIPKRENAADWIKNGTPNPGAYCKKNGWDFPLIIIRFSDLSDELKVLDGSKHSITHNISIEVHARTRKQSAELSQDIRTILQTTADSELVTGTLYLVAINGSTMDSDFIGSGGANKKKDDPDEKGNKFYIFTIDYMFKRFD